MTDPSRDRNPPDDPGSPDIQDRPSRQDSDDAPERLDREVDTLGVTGDPTTTPGDIAASDAAAMGVDDDGGHDGSAATTGGTA